MCARPNVLWLASTRNDGKRVKSAIRSSTKPLAKNSVSGSGDRFRNGITDIVTQWWSIMRSKRKREDPQSITKAKFSGDNTDGISPSLAAVASTSAFCVRLLLASMRSTSAPLRMPQEIRGAHPWGNRLHGTAKPEDVRMTGHPRNGRPTGSWHHLTTHRRHVRRWPL